MTHASKAIQAVVGCALSAKSGFFDVLPVASFRAIGARSEISTRSFAVGTLSKIDLAVVVKNFSGQR